MKLIGILNTEHNMERYKRGDMTRKELEDKAVYKELEESYRKASFKDVMEHMVKGEEGVGTEINDYLQQHNGYNLVCEVRVYDAEANRKQNADGSEIFKLEDKVASYIDSRQLETTSEEYDCLEITADLYSDVGGK